MKVVIVGFSLLIYVSTVCAQTCNNERYIDSLFGINVSYNVEYQQAKPYGSLFNLPYHMDIYEPAADTLPLRPLIIFQFGGGYLIGDKLNPPANDYCSYWAQQGYVCASINYRLGFNTLLSGSAERAVYRAVQDLQASLRFLVDERLTYGIDTSNIIVSGNSAGAISSLHSTYMDVDQIPGSASGFGFGLDSDDLGGPFSSGNTNFGNMEVMTHGVIACWGAMLDTNFVGDRPDDFIPIIMFHGEDDSAVMFTSGHPFSYPAFPILYGSQPLKVRMDNQGITSKLVPFPGAGHEPELLNPAYLDTILDESSHFMYHEVIRPEISSVAGQTFPLLNSTEMYTVFADDPINHMCVTSMTGNIISQTGNQVNVEWTVPGQDTLQIIAVNHILANDTVYVPIEVDNLTEMNSVHSNDGLLVFPNPSSGVANLENSIGNLVTVSVHTIDGRLVKQWSSSAMRIEINLSDHPRSAYVLQIQKNNGDLKRQLLVVQ